MSTRRPRELISKLDMQTCGHESRLSRGVHETVFPRPFPRTGAALGTRKSLRALCDTRVSVGEQLWHRVEIVDNPSLLAAAVPRTRRVTARLVVNQAIREGRDWSFCPPPTFLCSLGIALLSMPQTGKHASLGDCS